MRIEVPRDDHWFVVLEVGTYNGHARASVEVLAAGSREQSEPAFVEA
jgi:hypothetical protein